MQNAFLASRASVYEEKHIANRLGPQNAADHVQPYQEIHDSVPEGDIDDVLGCDEGVRAKPQLRHRAVLLPPFRALGLRDSREERQRLPAHRPWPHHRHPYRLVGTGRRLPPQDRQTARRRSKRSGEDNREVATSIRSQARRVWNPPRGTQEAVVETRGKPTCSTRGQTQTSRLRKVDRIPAQAGDSPA